MKPRPKLKVSRNFGKKIEKRGKIHLEERCWWMVNISSVAGGEGDVFAIAEAP